MQAVRFMGVGRPEDSFATWRGRLSKEGHRTALVERKMVGGSCPNVVGVPSKNIIHSAKVASLTARAAAFGTRRRSHGAAG